MYKLLVGFGEKENYYLLMSFFFCTFAPEWVQRNIDE